MVDFSRTRHSVCPSLFLPNAKQHRDSALESAPKGRLWMRMKRNVITSYADNLLLLLMLEIPLFSSWSTGQMNHPQALFQNWRKRMEKQDKPRGKAHWADADRDSWLFSICSWTGRRYVTQEEWCKVLKWFADNYQKAGLRKERKYEKRHYWYFKEL